MAEGLTSVLTTVQGIPVADDQNMLWPIDQTRICLFSAETTDVGLKVFVRRQTLESPTPTEVRHSRCLCCRSELLASLQHASTLFRRQLNVRRSFSSPRPAMQSFIAEVLEQRALLSADFAISADVLLLNGFTQNTDENVTIRENGANYEFVLSEGVWNGSDGSGVTGSGTGVLSIDKSAVTGLAGGIDIDGSGIAADVAFENADLSTLAGGLSVTGAGRAIITDGQSITVSSFFVSAFSISVSGEIFGASDAITLVAEQNVAFSTASLSTTSGDIRIEGNWTGPALAGTFTGVGLVASEIATDTGAIYIAGRGGDTGNESHGVVIKQGTRILSTGANGGDVTILGDGGGNHGGYLDYGVWVVGKYEGVQTSVQSATGDLLISGIGRESISRSHGVYLVGGATVYSTGQNSDAAKITFKGEGLSEAVLINQSVVTSSYGDIWIEGTCSTTFIFSTGVALSQQAVVASDGVGADAAKITIIGSGVATNNSHRRGDGVTISNRSTVHSIAGDISVTGSGFGTHGSGVRLIGESEIASTGGGAAAATITIAASGGGVDGGSGFYAHGSGGIEPRAGGRMRKTREQHHAVVIVLNLSHMVRIPLSERHECLLPLLVCFYGKDQVWVGLLDHVQQLGVFGILHLHI